MMNTERNKSLHTSISTLILVSQNAVIKGDENILNYVTKDACVNGLLQIKSYLYKTNSLVVSPQIRCIKVFFYITGESTI